MATICTEKHLSLEEWEMPVQLPGYCFWIIMVLTAVIFKFSNQVGFIMEENEYEEYKENYFKNLIYFCADFRCFVLSGSFVLDD